MHLNAKHTISYEQNNTPVSDEPTGSPLAAIALAAEKLSSHTTLPVINKFENTHNTHKVKHHMYLTLIYKFSSVTQVHQKRLKKLF